MLNRSSLLLLIPLLLGACTKFDPILYKVSGLQLHNSDNGGSKPVDSDSVAAKAYAIRLEFTLHIACSLKNTDTEESTYHLDNPATALNVYSLSGFDAAHPALSSLNDYFLYGARTSNVSGASTISRSISGGKIALDGLPGGRKIDESTSWTSSDYLVLMQEPDTYGSRDFVVNISFADRTEMKDTIHVNLYP